MQPFAYRKPVFERGKQVVLLGRTDRMVAAVQVLKSGGENNLHAHPHQDGFWMVLRGRVRFYGEGDVLLGDFGVGEGIIVPRGSLYWFESAGDEELELLQIQSFDVALPDMAAIMRDRVNVATVKSEPSKIVMHDAGAPSTSSG